MKNLPYCAGIFVSLVFLLSVPASLSARVLHQFAMYFADGMKAGECALVARSTETQKKQISYPGQLKADECRVTITQQEYENRFQFCYLSGFNLYKVGDPEMIECVIQKREDDYVFLVSGGNSDRSVKQVMCYFSCIGGSKK